MFYDFEIEEIREKFPDEEINLEKDFEDFELEGEQYFYLTIITICLAISKFGALVSSPDVYLATKVRVFKPRAKQQSLRITVYMDEKSVKDVVKSIMDSITPDYRIRIGANLLFLYNRYITVTLPLFN